MKIALLAQRTSDLQFLSEGLPLSQHSLQVSTVTGDLPMMVGELLKQRPDVAVAKVGDLADQDLALIEATMRSLPSTAMILLSSHSEPAFLLKAMRAGVREVVPLPLTNGELKEAFARQLDRASAAKGGPTGAKTMVFLPAKGGSGASFLATNVAYALAERGKRVAIIDLNLHFGDAALFLSEQRPTSTVADMCKQIDRADGELLRASMMPIGERLWLLASPESPERALEVKADAVDRLLTLARTQFDFVVIDAGRVIDPVGVKALDAADALYVVMQYSVPCIHYAKRLLMLMTTLGYPRDKVHLIANRIQKGSDITSYDVQKALSATVEFQIPNSYQAVSYSANHGLPILKHAPRDPVSRALREFAKTLVPDEVPVRAGWLGGLRRQQT